jgi:lipid-A-disaccharide synthase
MKSPLLFVSAGDPSGDIAASLMVRELAVMRPGLSTFGLGGKQLAASGQQQLAKPEDLAVIGFWEVIKRIGYFRELMHRTVREIERRKPACIVLVDYPGFNLRLAKRIRHLKIPIVYYISPQLWAWGGKRISQMRDLVDEVLAILPFEADFYAGTGVKANFVGHYLLEDIPEHMISSPVPGSKQLALLPGSRPQEIERMLGTMCEAAALFCCKHGFTAVVAGMHNGFDYDRILARFRNAPITIDYDRSREIIASSALALTASGTATLETGIIGRPMVIIYKTGFITYQIARHLVTVDKIGLINLVLGEKVMPELIQGQATPEGIADALERFVVDPACTQRGLEKLRRVPGLLKGRGASKRAATAIAEFL